MSWGMTEGDLEKEHSGTIQAKAETGIVRYNIGRK